MAKQRIVWIDTAKGICILLVVIYHSLIHTHADCLLRNTNVENFLCAFRMPLYFALSGIFFKTYCSFGNFIIRKVNKLIVPFLFFYILGSIIMPLLLEYLSLNLFSEYSLNELVTDCIYNHCRRVNGPLWFLPCLFVSNLLFYVIQKVSKNITYIVFGTILFGFIGVLLSINKIELPFCMSTSFTCVPFFCLGFVFNSAGLLNRPILSRNQMLAFTIVSILLIYLFAEEAVFSENRYENPNTVYFFSIIGTLFILLLSKKMGEIRFISYVGRYSLIVLCTHLFFIRLFYHLFHNIINSVSILCLLCSMFTILLCYLIIPFFLNHFPKFVAQKDLLCVKSKTESSNENVCRTL